MIYGARPGGVLSSSLLRAAAIDPFLKCIVVATEASPPLSSFFLVPPWLALDI